jgi:hypothetical protein
MKLRGGCEHWADGAHRLKAGLPKTSTSANDDKLRRASKSKSAQGVLDRIGYSPVEVEKQEGFNATRKSRVLRVRMSMSRKLAGRAVNGGEITRQFSLNL